jgi:hypothetical protein
MNHTIKIPDDGKQKKAGYHDKIWFEFTQDDQTFSFDPPHGLTPDPPHGPYPKGKKIGPFSPAAPNTTVYFLYDNSEKPQTHGMHSILVGK